MISLFENNPNVGEINVYLLGDNISDENKNILISIAEKYKRGFKAVDVPELKIPDTLCSQRWPRSAYTRLFSGELLPESLHKALYLDCDTIITGDISGLWNVDASYYTISGIKDCIGKLYKENIGLHGNSVYVNAGILLLNLDRLRKIDIANEITTFLGNCSKVINYADQDVLNGIFKGEFGILEPQYNVMTLLYLYKYNQVLKIRRPTNYYSKEEIENAVNNPLIVHFTTCMLAIRPWFSNSDHPYVGDFIKYKNISPWANKVLLEKKRGKGFRIKVLLGVFRLPNHIKFRFIGMMHSTILPLTIRLKAKF